MEYLTVGTNDIQESLYVPVKDQPSGIYKPKGGFWLTKYDPRYQNYNEWVDYLIDNPQVLFYKNANKTGTIWEQPCSHVILKDNANIYNLNTLQDYTFLKDNYPGNNMFSYEQLSKMFDGLYVDTGAILQHRSDELLRLSMQYSVSSLLLFNLKCIDYYYPGVVKITPFDLEYSHYEDISYQIECAKTRKRIR